METQLAYDQRRLELVQYRAEIVRDAMAVYSVNARSFTTEGPAGSLGGTDRSRPAPPAGGGTSEAVMPQVSDTFIDKLLLLTSQANDVQYRQKIVDEYQKAAQEVIPARATVAFDQEILQAMKSAAPAGAPATDVHTELSTAQNETRQLVVKVNEIYKILSRNLNPAGEIYTKTAPPIVRIERVRSFTRLILYGLLLVLLSIPVIIILCLLHARLREEERVEGYHAPEAAMAP